MPDRFAYTLRTAIASNTGGPCTYADNVGSQPAFTSLAVSVLVEPDA